MRQFCSNKVNKEAMKMCSRFPWLTSVSLSLFMYICPWAMNFLNWTFFPKKFYSKEQSIWPNLSFSLSKHTFDLNFELTQMSIFLLIHSMSTPIQDIYIYVHWKHFTLIQFTLHLQWHQWCSDNEFGWKWGNINGFRWLVLQMTAIQSHPQWIHKSSYWIFFFFCNILLKWSDEERSDVTDGMDFK